MGSAYSTLFGKRSRSQPIMDANERIATGPRPNSAPPALAIPAEASEAPLPQAETSTEKEIRELRHACKETKKQKPFPYPRFSLGSDVVSPVKDATETSRLTGSFVDPLWHQEQAYRSESGTVSSPSVGNQSGGTASLPAAVSQEAVVGAASPNVSYDESSYEQSVGGWGAASKAASAKASANDSEDVSEPSGSSKSASRKSASSGGISSPMGSGDISGRSIPYDVTGDSVAENGSSNVSSPPPSSAEPTPSKQMKVVVMSKRASLSPVPEGKVMWLCYRDGDQSIPEPMEVDIQLKRRSPSDAVLPEQRDIIRAVRSRTLSSCASSRSSSSLASSRKSLIVTADAMRMRQCRHRCPRCDQKCQKDGEDPMPRYRARNISEEVRHWRQTPHNCPTCQLRCRVESIFSSESEDEDSEMASVEGTISLDDYLDDFALDDDVSIIDDAQPAEQEQPLVGIAGSAVPCRSCGRNCPCVPVQRPEIPVAAPLPQPRRRRRQEPSVEEAWKQLELVEAICDVTLPAAPPTISEHLELVDSLPLDPNNLLTFLIRDTFQVALYIDGEVVLQGGFLGVEPTTDILREAAKRPVVIINDPLDKVTMIDAGDNHIVMKTASGQVMTLGRAMEGQLGATANPERFRQRAVNPANLRRFPAGPMGVVIESVEATGNTTTAWDEHGNVYRCGEGIGNWLETAKHRADRLAELAIRGL